jgi:hypothetical protein
MVATWLFVTNGWRVAAVIFDIHTIIEGVHGATGATRHRKYIRATSFVMPARSRSGAVLADGS